LFLARYPKVINPVKLRLRISNMDVSQFKLKWIKYISNTNEKHIIVVTKNENMISEKKMTVEIFSPVCLAFCSS
jgi:hypothetical protein